MQDPSPFSKTLASLNKRRLKGVRPINTLPGPAAPDRAALDHRDPKRPKLTTKAILDNVDLLLERAASHSDRVIRVHDPSASHEPLVADIPSPQPGASARSRLAASTAKEPPTTPRKTTSVKDVFNNDVDLAQAGLEHKALASIEVSSVNYNGRTNPANYTLLMMNLSRCHNYLYVSNGPTILDNTLVKKDQCLSIVHTTTGKSTLIQFTSDRGYLFVTNYARDADFMRTLAAAGWPVSPELKTHNEVLTLRNAIDSSRFSLHPPGKSEGTISDSWRATRRVSPRLARTSANYNEGVEEVETPAKLEPPLEFRFEDGKTMTIGSGDIKTLYNNEWINDNIIDFFINYEIENAVGQHKFSRHQIYNFNSFFFSRLIYRKSQSSEATYYQNIQRWLAKVDLFTHDFIIIPVNEHLHWYGCLIEGLPRLLKTAKDRQAKFSQETHDTLTDMPTNSSPVYVYTFDSLSSRHNKIKEPIFTFIAEHCKEKHNTELFESDLKFIHARVPKQNNFNDCGIHVIYNIRKWLEDRETCERVWRNFAHKFLKSSEIGGMRKELIKILLNLHELHGKISNKETKDFDDDDDIELLEYKTVNPDDSANADSEDHGRINGEGEPQASEGKQAPRAVKTSASPEFNVRRLRDSTSKFSPKSSALVNKQLAYNQELVSKLKPITMDTLNKVVAADDEVSEAEMKRILDFKSKVNELDPDKDEAKLNNEIKKLRIKLDLCKATHNKVHARPRDEDFVIRHSNGLDKSIQRLSLNGQDNPETEKDKEFDFSQTEFKIRKRPQTNSPKASSSEESRRIIVVDDDDKKDSPAVVEVNSPRKANKYREIIVIKNAGE